MQRVKIIENEPICENLVSHFSFTKFILIFPLDIFCTMPFCLIIEFEQVMPFGKARKLNERSVFFTFNLLVTLFRSSVFRVVLFFYISICWGCYAPSCNNFKGNIQMEEKAFLRWQKL